MQFAHFGVLDAGAQSKASTVTSLVLNLTIAFVVIVISAATAKRTIEHNKLLTNLVAPVVEKKPEPIKPKVIPPKPKPLPQLAKLEPPKITVPQVKLPEIPKQPIVKMDNPKPIITPPAPKKIIAPAAPVAVSLAHPEAASVPNHDAHPAPVQIGHPDMPFKDPRGPAVASVNLNSGFSGMNAANSGHGPAAAKVNIGNGSSTRQYLHPNGNGVVAVAGIPHGVPNATGTGKVAGGQQVSLGVTPPPADAQARCLSHPPSTR